MYLTSTNYWLFFSYSKLILGPQKSRSDAKKSFVTSVIFPNVYILPNQSTIIRNRKLTLEHYYRMLLAKHQSLFRASPAFFLMFLFPVSVSYTRSYFVCGYYLSLISSICNSVSIIHNLHSLQNAAWLFSRISFSWNLMFLIITVNYAFLKEYNSKGLTMVIFAISIRKYNFNATEEECKYHV